MAESTTFRIVTIPRLQNGAEPDAKTTALAERFRELRLRALRLAPEAFASKWEDETHRSLDQTLDRLSKSKATHFIAVRMPASARQSFDGDDDMERVLKADWLGVIVLLGPQEDNASESHPSGDPFVMMSAAGREDEMLSTTDQLRTPKALHFHLNGMFVDPSARGGGLGLALIESAVRRAEAAACRLSAGLRVTIAVYDHNVAAHKLYEKAGFKEVHRRPSKTRGPEATAVDMQMSLAAAP